MLWTQCTTKVVREPGPANERPPQSPESPQMPQTVGFCDLHRRVGFLGEYAPTTRTITITTTTTAAATNTERTRVPALVVREGTQVVRDPALVSAILKRHGRHGRHGLGREEQGHEQDLVQGEEQGPGPGPGRDTWLDPLGLLLTERHELLAELERVAETASAQALHILSAMQTTTTDAASKADTVDMDPSIGIGLAAMQLIRRTRESTARLTTAGEQLRNKLDGVRAQLSETRAESNKDKIATQSRVAELVGRLEDGDSHNASLERDLALARVQLTDLDAQRDSAATNQDRERLEVKAKIADLETQLRDNTVQNGELRARLVSCRAELETSGRERLQLAGAVDSANRGNAELRSEIARLGDQERATQASLAANAERLQSLETANSVLAAERTASIAEADRVTSALAAERSQHNASREAVRDSRESLETDRARIEELEASVAMLQARVGTLQEELDKSQTAGNQQRQALAEMRGQLQTSESSRAEFAADRDTKIAELEVRLQASTASAESAQVELERVRTEMQSKTAQIAELESRAERLALETSQQAARSEAEKTTLIASHRAELLESRQAADDQAREVESLRRDRSGLERKLSSAESSLSTCSRLSEMHEGRAKAATARAARLDKERSRLAAEVERTRASSEADKSRAAAEVEQMRAKAETKSAAAAAAHAEEMSKLIERSQMEIRALEALGKTEKIFQQTDAREVLGNILVQVASLRTALGRALEQPHEAILGDVNPSARILGDVADMRQSVELVARLREKLTQLERESSERIVGFQETKDALARSQETETALRASLERVETSVNERTRAITGMLNELRIALSAVVDPAAPVHDFFFLGEFLARHPNLESGDRRDIEDIGRMLTAATEAARKSAEERKTMQSTISQLDGKLEAASSKFASFEESKASQDRMYAHDLEIATRARDDLAKMFDLPRNDHSQTKEGTMLSNFLADIDRYSTSIRDQLERSRQASREAQIASSRMADRAEIWQKQLEGLERIHRSRAVPVIDHQMGLVESGTAASDVLGMMLRNTRVLIEALNHLFPGLPVPDDRIAGSVEFEIDEVISKAAFGYTNASGDIPLIRATEVRNAISAGILKRDQQLSRRLSETRETMDIMSTAMLLINRARVSS